MNSCEICGVSYNNLNSLMTHIRRKHNTTFAILKAQREDVELLKCVICGFESNNLRSHIKFTHDISLKEFSATYPTTELSRQTQEQIDKQVATKAIKWSKNKDAIKEAKRRAEETRASGSEDLVCQICGKTSANSLISHITRSHKVNMQEYRGRFPGFKVQQASPSNRVSSSRAMKERLQDPIERDAFLAWRSFPSEVKHWIKKGYDPCEAQEKVAQWQREQSLKGNNEETRALRSMNSSGQNNPMSLTNIAQREGVTEDEASKLTPCYGRVSEKHPMFGKHHTPESLAKIASAPHLINPNYRSKQECEIEQECRKLTDNLQTNVGIGKWNVDVLFSDIKLIVEHFGDWWHMNPQKYAADAINRVTKKTASYMWERDERKIKELTSAGYEVVVIWESDWHNDRDGQLERVKNAFNRV